jgi:hypothetical protein
VLEKLKAKRLRLCLLGRVADFPKLARVKILSAKMHNMSEVRDLRIKAGEGVLEGEN